MDLTPTTSVTTAQVMGDCLAIALLERRGFRAEDFRFLHPGGVIGGVASRGVEELMHERDALPKVLESASLRYTVVGRDLAAGAMFEPVVRFVNELRARPRVVTERIFQTFGAYEPLAEPNRAMTEVLQRLAGEVRVVEGLDGHNWTNWRDDSEDRQF